MNQRVRILDSVSAKFRARAHARQSVDHTPVGDAAVAFEDRRPFPLPPSAARDSPLNWLQKQNERRNNILFMDSEIEGWVTSNVSQHPASMQPYTKVFGREEF